VSGFCDIAVGLQDDNDLTLPAEPLKRGTGRAVSVRQAADAANTGVPAPPGHVILTGVKYRDVHAIDQPDLRKTFKSLSRMRAWFEEHSAGAKGGTRSD
jgi:hypothetical protein